VSDLPRRKARENSGLIDVAADPCLFLPHCRLLADARYCQQKLGELSVRGRSNAMLETIVSDKPVAPSASPVSLLDGTLHRPSTQIPLSPTAPAPQRVPSLSANQRIKGMFARAAAKASVAPEAAAAPARADIKSPPPPPPPDASEKTPAMAMASPPARAANGDAALPPTPQEAQEPRPGFKQVVEDVLERQRQAQDGGPPEPEITADAADAPVAAPTAVPAEAEVAVTIDSLNEQAAAVDDSAPDTATPSSDQIASTAPVANGA
jgi:hypothetical protein